ncbi:MAG: hypothetical protein IKP01_06305, partial [Bacteroidales bacterium]|nr:hypothetical protein [Bacteroidales bacterium]
MKRMMIFGCLAGALACAACERLADSDVSRKEEETVVRKGDVVFSLDEVARLFAALPVGKAQVAEVRDAVTASAGNGYDEEYTLQNLFEAPGSGVGSTPVTRVEGYPEPLRDLLAAEVRRQYGTRAEDPEAFLDALSASDVQLYWPFSEDFTSDEAPIVTFNPGDNASRNIGYIRREDGTIEEIVVDEEMARERPVWVVNRNIDAEYRTLEMRRREDPDWGQGGNILVRSGDGPETRADGKDFKTLVLRSFKSNRNFDSWLAGGSEVWVKCGAVEDFTASTEAELRLYTPSITDFLIVVRRKDVGKELTFNAVLVSEWTGMLDNCA